MALTVLAEDLGLITITHIRKHRSACNSNSKGSTILWTSEFCTWCTQSHERITTLAKFKTFLLEKMCLVTQIRNQNFSQLFLITSHVTSITMGLGTDRDGGHRLSYQRTKYLVYFVSFIGLQTTVQALKYHIGNIFKKYVKESQRDLSFCVQVTDAKTASVRCFR